MFETTVRIKPVDRDGPSIVIFKEASSGKVAIGRGEFLRCADKKVSRVHAELELDVDGQLYLTPLHVNPCFYFHGGDEQNREEVRKGDRRILHGGDHFSLLPSSYIYKVDVGRIGESSVDRPHITCKDHEKALNNGGSKLSDDHDDAKQISANSAAHKTTNAGWQTSNNNSKIDDEISPDAQPSQINDPIETGNGMRKRTLPAWLMEVASAAQSPEDLRPSTSSRKTKKTPQTKYPAAKMKAQEKASTSRRKSFSDSNDDACDDSLTGESSNKVKNSVENDDTKSTKINSKAASMKKRSSCQFGAECYRKNPAHWKEFSHPGDSDYSPDTKDNEIQEATGDVDPNDTRPECEYGLNCYRKNTQHRKNYKHTSRPRTQRKAAKQAKEKTTRQSDEDSYNSYDDSFIDDDDDSDEYKPSKEDTRTSSDEYEEDLKRLKQEADSFVRNKKLHKMH